MNLAAYAGGTCRQGRLIHGRGKNGRKEGNMIRNIIFDIGNVLTDFRWKAFLEDKGFAGEVLERIANASVLSPAWSELDRGVWTEEQVLNGFVRNDPELEKELHRAYDHMGQIVTIRDYAEDWVQELKAKGYAVYYLSNFSEKIERECRDALSFRRYMDGGILSYQDRLIKPDPAVYELLLRRYGLKAQECVFLDDTPVNIEAGRKLGIRGIVFQSREQAQEELSRLLKG